MNKDKAIEKAKLFGLEKNVENMIAQGFSPDSALWEHGIPLESEKNW